MTERREDVELEREGPERTEPFILQVAGYKNTGKTTWLTGLIHHLNEQGIRSAVIKHDAHSFDMDHPGTDTFKLREAGAVGVAITSAKRTAIIEEYDTSLEELIAVFSHSGRYDCIFIEGFKQADYPKLVMIRQETDLELLDSLMQVIGAVYATDCQKLVSSRAADIMLYDYSKPKLAADWIVDKLKRK
ncbi:molybdopterin-guanine dinucleotide biosynthesis protein B [Paenibacillus massiliensis]|uniref:molybdopterin-guanine dinucleotide biosynthesis protein B n=1 Tax=Paenibacillus massiliensis TaxID=225917 RepID=UPI0004288972|nr:molybdopterin-guanine dinucleotide biosynthesis protein B [Paenibacillus massiliensis]